LRSLCCHSVYLSLAISSLCCRAACVPVEREAAEGGQQPVGEHGVAPAVAAQLLGRVWVTRVSVLGSPRVSPRAHRRHARLQGRGSIG
jgi:hypothetical protein